MAAKQASAKSQPARRDAGVRQASAPGLGAWAAWSRRPASDFPALWLVLATVLCLLPFVDKAFHIDDPLFLWVARQIQAHPVDFYGFKVNWYLAEQPMSAVTKNPPLTSYYTALATALFGWGEVPLHLAFLVWPVGAVWGTYRLAERLCTRPLLAALATLLTPVFLVSSTSVMCDTMMLCLWVWAVVWWLRGLERAAWLPLCVSGILIGLCALTKYFGMCLIPLLLVYALVERRGVGRWLLALLIPVAILAAYQGLTHALYGKGLLLDAADYATMFQEHFELSFWVKLLVGLSFTGGCVASAIFFLPLLWSRGVVLAGLGMTAVLIGLLSLPEKIGYSPLHDEFGVRWAVVIQLALYSAAGLVLLALAGVDLWQHRDAGSLLLFLWVIGTYLFAGFVNWTVNGRSVLPMVPAAGILLMRRLDLRRGPRQPGELCYVAWPLLPAAALALVVAWADYWLADAARMAATNVQEIKQELQARNWTGTVWFEGHWGFQYYMQRAGARVIDSERSPREFQRHDILVWPTNNTNIRDPAVSLRFVTPPLAIVTCPWLGTMDRSVSAGFYSAIGFGPLPFGFGRVPPEEYRMVWLQPLTEAETSELQQGGEPGPR